MARMSRLAKMLIGGLLTLSCVIPLGLGQQSEEIQRTHGTPGVMPDLPELSPSLEATDALGLGPSTPVPNDASTLGPMSGMMEQPRWFLMGRPGGQVQGDNVRVTIVASHANPGVLLVPLGEYGVLLSADGGTTWTNLFDELLASGLSANVSEVSAGTEDPNALYAIAGGQLALSRNLGESWEVISGDMGILAFSVTRDGQGVYAVSEGGFHSSLDGGATWTTRALSEIPRGFQTTALVVGDAGAPSVVYALVNDRLFLTETGGDQWRTPDILSSVSIRQVVADQQISGLAYALTRENALYRTQDAGRTWGLAFDLSEYGQYAGATFYSDPILYAALNGSIYIRGTASTGGTEEENSCGLALFVSNNEGVTWTQLDHFPLVFGCSSVRALAFDPENPRRIHALVTDGYGMITFLQSSDGGMNLMAVPPLGRPIRLSASAGGDFVYVSGMAPAVSTDSGRTWVDVTEAIVDRADGDGCRYDTYLGIVQDPRVPLTAYLVATGHMCYANMLKTEDGGGSWEDLHVPFGQREVARIAINPTNGDLYSGQPNLLSRDAGVTWRSWPDIESVDIYSFAVNPDSPTQVLLGAIDGGLYVSEDGGSSVGIRGLGADFSVYSVAFAPSTGKVYAVVEASDHVALYASGDAGATWVAVSDLSNVGAALDYGYFWARFYGTLLVDPRTPDTLYLARREVYKSSDGGISWSLLGAGMTRDEAITDMVITTGDSPMLYAVGRGGLWRYQLP